MKDDILMNNIYGISRSDGTAVIPMREYLELKEYKEFIQKDGVYCESFGIEYLFKAKEDVLSFLENRTRDFEREQGLIYLNIEDKKRQKKILEDSLKGLSSMIEIKKLSIWEFMKWRKS